MPTVLRSGPYRFFFFASDGNEPVHVHVERERRHAKFWIDPVRLELNRGFRRQELNRIRKFIEQHRSDFIEKWNEFFDS